MGWPSLLVTVPITEEAVCPGSESVAKSTTETTDDLVANKNVGYRGLGLGLRRRLISISAVNITVLLLGILQFFTNNARCREKERPATRGRAVSDCSSSYPDLSLTG